MFIHLPLIRKPWNVDEQYDQKFTRLSAAALFKFLAFRMRRLFEGDAV